MDKYRRYGITASRIGVVAAIAVVAVGVAAHETRGETSAVLQAASLALLGIALAGFVATWLAVALAGRRSEREGATRKDVPD